MPLSAEELRLLNLIELLVEQARELHVETLQEPPDDAYKTWTEEQIRRHFQTTAASGGKGAAGATLATCCPAAAAAGAPSPPAACREATAAISGSSNGTAGAAQQQQQQQQPLPSSPDEAELNKWFPSLNKTRQLFRGPAAAAGNGSGAAAEPILSAEVPCLRLLAFPSAGNAEDMYTSEGTGTRRAPNALLDWCRANGAELWAVQPPGRGLRLKEPPCSSARDMARRVFAVAARAVVVPAAAAGAPAQAQAHQAAVPYAVISHSMGCWVAFEFLKLVQASGLPPPARWFLSAMPPPDIPHEQRPWRVSAHLDEEAFKDECRGWDVNDVVFTAAMWPIYQPLMRADFAIFDQYVNDDDPADNGYYGDSAAADAAAAAAAATRAECSPQPAADGGHTICGLGGLGSNGSCSGVEAAHTSLLPDSSLTSVLSDKAAVAAETRLCPAKPVGAPITAFWARRDRRVTRDMVSGWRRFAAAGAPSFCGCGASCAAAASTDAADGGDYRSAASPPILSSSSASQFELLEVDGNHLFPLAPDAKRAWFGHITARLDSLVISRRR